MRVDRAEESEGVRLVATFLVLPGERQRTLGEDLCFLQTIGQHMCLPQAETAERLVVGSRRCRALLQGLREERHGVSAALV